MPVVSTSYTLTPAAKPASERKDPFESVPVVEDTSAPLPAQTDPSTQPQYPTPTAPPEATVAPVELPAADTTQPEAGVVESSAATTAPPIAEQPATDALTASAETVVATPESATQPVAPPASTRIAAPTRTLSASAASRGSFMSVSTPAPVEAVAPPPPPPIDISADVAGVSLGASALAVAPTDSQDTETPTDVTATDVATVLASATSLETVQASGEGTAATIDGPSDNETVSATGTAAAVSCGAGTTTVTQTTVTSGDSPGAGDIVPEDATLECPDPAAVPGSGPSPPLAVVTSEGGVATVDNGAATVEFGAGAVTGDTQIWISASTMSSGNLVTLSPVFDLNAADVASGNAVTSFAQPVLLTIKYDVTAGVPVLYYLDPTLGPVALDTVVDLGAGTASTTTSHFSHFVVAVGASPNLTLVTNTTTADDWILDGSGANLNLTLANDPSHAAYTFTAPTTTLTIDLGSGNDKLTIKSVGSFGGTLHVIGGPGDDLLATTREAVALPAVTHAGVERMSVSFVRDLLTSLGVTVEAATVITHGFQPSDSGGDSLITLARAIRNRADAENGANGAWFIDYDIDVHGGLGSIHIADSHLPTGAGTGHIVFLWDWAADTNEPTSGWASASGDALFATIIDLGLVDVTAPLSQPPLHLIGHSFGTAVTSELTRRLAAINVTVDHLTYLDPHDFNQGLGFDYTQRLFELGPLGYGAVVWNNVTFADVYYQTRSGIAAVAAPRVIPDGRPIPGAYNRWMSVELPGVLAGVSDHSWIWDGFYLATVLGDGDEDVDDDGLDLLEDLDKDNVLDNLADPYMAEGYAYSRVRSGVGSRPAPRFFTTTAGSSAVVQQGHEHTPAFLVDALGQPALHVVPSGTAPDALYPLASRFGGYFPDGTQAAILENARWAPGWSPLRLYNGDFEKSNVDTDDVHPGWSHHGGGGLGGFGGETFGSNDYLELDDDGPSRTHNLFYLPSNATHLLYRFEIDTADSLNQLRISLSGTQLALLPLGTPSSGFVSGEVAIPVALRNKVHTLTFAIVVGAVEAVVNIDNVRFTNRPTTGTALSGADATALSNGLDTTVATYQAMHSHGAIGQELPLIGLAPSDVNAFHTQLLAAINAAKTYLAAVGPTVEGLVELLTEYDVIDFVEAATSATEFSWQFEYTGRTRLASVPLDFGVDTGTLGVSIDADVEVTGFAKIRSGFAIIRATSTFQLRPSELTLGIAVDVQDLDAALRAGFLEAAVVNGTALLTAYVTVRFDDPTSSDGGLSAADLGTSLASLIDVSAGGTLDATLPVTASIGGTNPFAAASPKIVVSSDDLFDLSAYDVQFVQFDEFLSFTNTGPNEIMAMLQAIANALTAMVGTELRQIVIPFSNKTVGDILDYGTAFKKRILDPLFKSGDLLRPDFNGDGRFDFDDLSFSSVQTMITKLGTALGLPSGSLAFVWTPATKTFSFRLDFSKALGFGAAKVEEKLAGSGSQNEVQKVTLNAVGVSFAGINNTYRLAFPDLNGVLQFTNAIAYNAIAGTIDSALEGLNGINRGLASTDNVGVVKNGDVIEVTFRGALANTNVALMTSDATDLAGSFSFNLGAALGPIAGIQTQGTFTLLASLIAGMSIGLDLNPNQALEVTPAVYTPIVSATADVPVGATTNATQVLTFQNVNGGTFTLELDLNGDGDADDAGERTAAISYSTTAGTLGTSIQTALDGLGGGSVNLGAPAVVSFGNIRIVTVTLSAPATPARLLLNPTSLTGPATNGRLTSNATFNVSVINQNASMDPDGTGPLGSTTITGGTIFTLASVVVQKTATDGNASLADLAVDVQAAINNAIASGGHSVGFLKTTGDATLLSTGALALATALVTAAHNPFTAMKNDLAFTVVLIVGSTEKKVNGRLRAVDVLDSTGVTGSLFDAAGAVSTEFTTQAITAATLATKLTAAVNSALEAAGFGTYDVTFGTSSGKLTYDVAAAAGSDTVEVQFASPIKVDAGGGRLSLSTTPAQLTMSTLEPAVSVDRRLEVTVPNGYNDSAFQELGLMSAPTRLTGVTSTEIRFTAILNGTAIQVIVAPSASRTSIAQLIADLNSAISTALGATSFGTDALVAYRIDPNGNRIGLKAKQGTITTLQLNVPVFVSGSQLNGAVSELGFASGNGSELRSRATSFFLENVTLTGNFRVDLPSVTATANIGFLGVTATGQGTVNGTRLIDATIGLSLRNPIDGTNKLSLDVIARALGAGKVFFDLGLIGHVSGTPTTGFLAGQLSGGFGVRVDVEPAGGLSGLAPGLDAFVSITASSPNWIRGPPSFTDALGVGAAPTTLGATPFQLTAQAPTGWVFTTDRTFILRQGAHEALILIRASATAENTTAAHLQSDIQAAIDAALLRIDDLGGDGGTVGVLVNGTTRAITLTGVIATGDDPLQVRANVVDIQFQGPDFSGVLDKFKDLSFTDVLQALQAIVGFIRSLDGSGGSSAIAAILDTKLPLVDRSISELIDLATALSTKLDEIAANPAGSLQALETLIRSRFGIGSAVPPVLSWNTTTNAIDINFSFLRSVNVSRPFNLSLAGAGGLPSFLTDLVGVSATGNVNVNASLELVLALGLDITNKQFFVNVGPTGTRLVANASVSGTDLDFEARLGPFGLFVRDGSASAGAGITVKLVDGGASTTDGKLILLGYSTGSGLTSDLGQLGTFVNVVPGFGSGSVVITTQGATCATGVFACVSLPVYVGTEDALIPIDFGTATPGAPETTGGPDHVLRVSINLFEVLDGVGDGNNGFTFQLPDFDFGSFQPPSLFALLSNPSVIINGLDRVLQTLQNALNGQIFGKTLPLIGDLLANNPASRIIEDFRAEILQPLAQLIRENNANLQTLVSLVRSKIAHVLGPTGPFAAFGGLLKDVAGSAGLGPDGIKDAFDVLLSGANPANPFDSTPFMEFAFDIEKVFTFTAPPIKLDIGIPALGIDASLQPHVTIDFRLHFGFGVHSQTGFYFVTNPSGAPELQLAATVAFSAVNCGAGTATRAQVNGRLLFLALKVKDGVDLDGDATIDVNCGPVTQPKTEELSKVFLTGSVDIADPNNDGKLTLPEILSGSFKEIVKPSIIGGAVLRLDATVDFSTINPDVGAALPSVSAQILLDFVISFDTASGFQVNAPGVAIANITLDLGKFISEFAAPILNEVKKILDPLEWLIGPEGFLNARIPLLSDLAGRTITGKDLVVLFDPENGPKVVAFLDFVQTLYFLIDLVEDAKAEGNVKLDFGDLLLSNPSGYYNTGFPIINSPIGINLPGFSDLRKAPNLSGASLGSTPGAPVSSATAGAATNRFRAGVSSQGGFHFKLLDPSNIMQLFLGKPVTIFEVQFPELGFDFFYRQEFPIIGPLVGTFGGGVSARLQVGFGYDTLGISKFVNSGNPGALLDGFYLTDLDPVTGVDRPEATLSAQIAVGAALSIVIAKIGVEGGIEATIFFNFADLDADGKIRFSEMAENVIANGGNPLAVFDVSGLLEFFLRAYVEINLFITKIRFEYEFPRLKLFEFNIPFVRPGVLANLSGTDLTLHVGASAGERLNGNIADGNESITVESVGSEVWVYSTMFGRPRDAAMKFSGVSKVIGDGGAGNDTIDASLVVGVVVELHGGVGDDILKGGGAADLLFGDDGNDDLFGNGGADTLTGGLGNDDLFGGAGTDTLLGNEGNDTLTGGADADHYQGGPGDDDYLREASDGDDHYQLFDFGSEDEITGTGAGSDILDFSGLLQNLVFFLEATTIKVGYDRFTGDGSLLAHYNHRLNVTNATSISLIIGGDDTDTFHVRGTAGAITLAGAKGNDKYFFYADGSGTASPITATVDEVTVTHTDGTETVSHAGDPWNMDDLIEIVGSSSGDTITVTSSTITLNAAATQVVTYVPPAADGNVIQIKIKGNNGDDVVTVASTAQTVPVRVEGGAGNDVIRVGPGGGGSTVDNIVGLGRPGLNAPYGLGQLVIVGGSDHDTVIVDDSGDTSNDTGTMTAFTETRSGVTGTVEVGVVTGFGMQWFEGTTSGAGRVEYEGVETVDLRLGGGDDTLTLGGNALLGTDVGDLPQNRQVASVITGFVHTISGMTILRAGGGNDTLNVLATNQLNRVTLDGAMSVVSVSTNTQGGTSVNEVQHVTVSDKAKGVGWFTLSYRFQETKPIEIGATADAVRDALTALFLIGLTLNGDSTTSPNVAVTKTTLGNGDIRYAVTFQHGRAAQNVPELVARIIPLLVAGGAGNDQLNVQSIREATFFVGGNETPPNGDTVRMNVDVSTTSYTPLATNGVNATVTLDGEGGTDFYYVNLIGGSTDSLINVFDSGTAGSDKLTIYGTEQADLFLARASAAETGLAFVAKMNTSPNVERVNYDVNLEDIIIDLRGGDDEMYVDGTRAKITVEAGSGDDFFQIAQLYKERRTPLLAGVADYDVYATIETTRGWLSDGINKPMTINGGSGKDEFIVFHNLAVLTLNGGDDDDKFLIQAFALAGSQEKPREVTDLAGDAGADFIQYAVNAPVNINGGDGRDTLVVIGTEFSDDFVVTKNGVFGAGLYVNFVNIEFVEVDGAEGNDRFFVQSTGATFVTVITGGLGTDLVSIMGPTPANGVISNDLRGHSGIITHGVESTVAASSFDGIKVIGVSSNVADNDEPAIIVTETGGLSQVIEGAGTDEYTIVLARPMRFGTEVRISITPPKGIVLLDTDGTSACGAGSEFRKDCLATGEAVGMELLFTPTNWMVPQTVRFKADVHATEKPDIVDIQHSVTANDRVVGTVGSVTANTLTSLTPSFTAAAAGAPEGLRGAMVTIISSTSMEDVGQVRMILSNTADTLTLNKAWTQLPFAMDSQYEIRFYSAVQLVNVRVELFAASRPAIVVAQEQGYTSVAEGARTDTIQVRLSSNPGGTVMISLASSNNDVSFSSAASNFAANTITFDGSNWMDFVTVTFTAVDDAVVEGFHKSDATLTAAGAGAYNGKKVTVITDVTDNEIPGVLVLESDGSTNVIEVDDSVTVGSGAPWTDTYFISLTKAPAAGETVTITVRAEPTRTSRLDIRSFTQQVELCYDDPSAAGACGLTEDTFSDTITLTFDSTNWSAAKTVTVRALNDARVDGGDSQVFAPILDYVNNVQGPLRIRGGLGDDRTGLFEREPVMLPKGHLGLAEFNRKQSMGFVHANGVEAAGGAPAKVTINGADLSATELTALGITTLTAASFTNLTFEITNGPAKNKVRIITGAVETAPGSGIYELSLDRTWLSVFTGNADTPTTASEWTLSITNPNFLVDEKESIDFLIVNDTDNPASHDDPARNPNPFGKGEMFTDGAGKHRLIGFGMGGDREIAGVTEPGGITYEEMEDFELNLGSGNNHLLVKNTQSGVTTVTAGAGNDTVEIWKIGGHTFVNLGAGTDSIRVSNTSNTLADLNGLLTVSGDVPQVRVTTLANGSPVDGATPAADEIQRVTVDATGGTFRLRLNGEYTGNIAWNATKADLAAALAGLSAVDLADVDVSKFGNTYRVHFTGALAGTVIDELGVDDSLLTNGLGVTDTLTIDDSGYNVDGTGVLTPSSLTGLSTPQRNEIQTVVLNATNGTWTLSYAGQTTAALAHDVSAAALDTALEALSTIGTGNVAVTRTDDVYVIRFQGELNNLDVASLVANAAGLTLVIENLGGSTSTGTGVVAVTTRVEGSATPVNDMQYLNVNATGGTYTLSLINGQITTGAIRHDATADELRRAIQAAFAGTDPFRAVLFDVTVDRYGSVYAIGFQGALRALNGGPGADLLHANTSLLTGTVAIADRMDGINYYGFEVVNVDTGTQTEVFNVQGTTGGSNGFTGIAVTNIDTNAGNDRVFVSSDADLDHASWSDFQFLTGHLDAVRGALNIDLGTGRHRLFISDEAASVGDGSVRISDSAPAFPSGLSPSAEIWITGLAPAGISYKVAPSANLFDGVAYWSGSGTDTILIDGTHNRAGERTTTLLNTGLGNDNVTVTLLNGLDGFFTLHTSGGSTTDDPLAIADQAPDNDIVNAVGSSLPLVIFGGFGSDTITGGTNNDLIFGDFGRVQYIDPVSGAMVATHGFGGRADVISSLIVDPRWAISRHLTLGGADTIQGNSGQDVLVGGAGSGAAAGSFDDYIDGDMGSDLIFGDAVELFRRNVDVNAVNDVTNPHFQMLSGATIYDDALNPLISNAPIEYRDPSGTPHWAEYLIVALFHSFALQADQQNRYGKDYIAGGGQHDVIFGQLGDDTIQGDGAIELAFTGGVRVSATPTVLHPSFDDRISDGHDYVEGGGGNDTIFGNLGQDDLIGGSSDLYTLTTREQRPDGLTDFIFGGSGTELDLNDSGDTLDVGHAFDADAIAGDNASFYRLVAAFARSSAFLSFAYDSYGSLKVVIRAFKPLDYSPTGDANYMNTDPNDQATSVLVLGANRNIGGGDFMYGESGDDLIHGQTGNDRIWGGAQDDDIYGESGYDWVSGGTGDDGILGDDGALRTSRNGTPEPLYGIGANAQIVLSTPGDKQTTTIYSTGALYKEANLEPFYIGNNDVLYGGWGDDKLHGGAGDDAMSGAEALPYYYGGDPLATLAALSAFYAVGNVLQHGFRPAPNETEFRWYNENDPFRKIMISVGIDFLLNFAGGSTASPIDDGQDVLFGDVGHDWLVGGTNHDRMWGGYGDDLMQADDNLDSTALTADPLANNIPDTRATAPLFSDIAYGGAGRDVLIANTAVDRMLDWSGEFNSYLVPYAPFGEPTITRSVAPHVKQWLYDISRSDGADRSRPGAAARNGEPFGEIGLVSHEDADWGDQHGGPADPQPGHITQKRDERFVGNVGVRTPGGAAALLRIFSLMASSIDADGDLLSRALLTVAVNGDAKLTKKTSAVFELGYHGGATLASMRFSLDSGATWSAWQAYSEYGDLELPSGDGEKFILIQVLAADGTTYEASDMITLDSKGPVLSLSGLANGAILDVSASVRFVYSASDESGATASATLDTKTLASGSIIDAGLLTAGSHLITVTGVDAAGNTTIVTITFIVRASTFGLIGEVEQAIAAKHIDASQRGVLLSKLNAAQTAIEQGKRAQAIAQLEQFIAQVQANAGKKIEAALADRLIGWARGLISGL